MTTELETNAHVSAPSYVSAMQDIPLGQIQESKTNPRRLALALPRRPFHGCPLRHSRAAQESRIHDRSDYEPCAGYRREHGDFFFAQRTGPSRSACGRSRSNWYVSARKVGKNPSSLCRCPCSSRSAAARRCSLPPSDGGATTFPP
jgi:hypothetical protein